MSDLLTPAARRILSGIRTEADEMARLADDPDTPPYLRTLYAAKRDTYERVVRDLAHDLPDVEREAVEIEVSESARMDALLDAFEGVPA